MQKNKNIPIDPDIMSYLIITVYRYLQYSAICTKACGGRPLCYGQKCVFAKKRRHTFFTPSLAKLSFNNVIMKKGVFL